MKKSRPSKFGFFHSVLAVGLAIPLLMVSGARAQDAVARPGAPSAAAPPQTASAPAASGAAATAERIIVTGSNIPTAEEVGPNPVQTFDRQTLLKSGERNTEEFLRNLPIANANGVPTSNNENGTNSAVGAATIALRAFDTRATLILLDGRRVAPYPTGNNGGIGVGQMFVDLIPSRKPPSKASKS